MRSTLVVIALAACAPASTTTTPTPPAVTPPPTASAIRRLATVPADALVLRVRVVRWACTITDEHGVIDPDLHVPTGRAVSLILTNEDGFEELDVTIPDATARVHLPRRATAQIALQVDRAGEYAWECPTQQPDPPNPNPRTPIIAMTPDAYATYQIAHREETQPTSRGGQIALGKKLYERKGCISCHTVDGSPRIGPSWAGIWGTKVTLADGSTRVVDRTYIGDSIITPQAFARSGFPPAMPSFEGQLRPWEVDALIVYIESLAHVKPM